MPLHEIKTKSGISSFSGLRFLGLILGHPDLISQRLYTDKIVI